MYRIVKPLLFVAASLAVCLSVMVAQADDENPTVTEHVTAEPVSSRTLIDDDASRRTIAFDRSYTNDHCAGNKRIRWEIRPNKGWKIDPTMVDFRATVVSKKSTYHGVNITEELLTVSGVVRNNGTCIPPFIRDARGTLRVVGTYDEVAAGTID